MKTIRECAEICNCSKTSITRLIKQLNITTIQDKNRLLVSDEDTKKLQQHVGNIAPNATQTAPDEIKIAQKIETSIPENAPQQVETAPNKMKTRTKIAPNTPETETQHAKTAPNKTKTATKIAPNTLEIETQQAKNAPNETKTATKIETNAPENATQQAKNAPNCTKTHQIETENATFNTNRNTTSNADIISIYCETIELLKEQLKQKDKQIQSLQEENKLLIQSNAFSLKQLEEKNKAEAIQKQEQEPDIKVYVEKSKAAPSQEVVKKKKKFILSWFNKS